MGISIITVALGRGRIESIFRYPVEVRYCQRPGVKLNELIENIKKKISLRRKNLSRGIAFIPK